jgi:hypothetical protein
MGIDNLEVLMSEDELKMTKKQQTAHEKALEEQDVAPDEDDDGDNELPEEFKDLVHDHKKDDIVPDQADRKDHPR